MKKSERLLTIVILLALLSQTTSFPSIQAAQPGQVTVYPTDDTYADSDNPDSNYGGQPDLYVSKYQWLSTNYERTTWLKFDLTSIPAIEFVDTATLQLRAGIPTETYTVFAHSCSVTSWTELALTYSNMPAYNTTAMDHETVATGFLWYNWTVIDAVKKSSGSVAIVLLETTLRSALSSATFFSKEQGVYKPKLTVHWTDVPEFPPSLILPLLMLATSFAVIVLRRKIVRASP